VPSSAAGAAALRTMRAFLAADSSLELARLAGLPHAHHPLHLRAYKAAPEDARRACVMGLALVVSGSKSMLERAASIPARPRTIIARGAHGR